jgi:S1-C subfamily serine protease
MKNFRNLLKISLLSFLVGGCCTAFLQHEQSDQSKQLQLDNKIAIENLRQTTVAIVDTSLGKIIPTCSGVWIDQNIILTAAHCVEDSTLIEYSTVADYNNEKVKKAIVIAADKQVDLAIIVSSEIDEPHPVASLSGQIISTGDKVNIVGHPVGYAWTYSSGYVSSIRSNMSGPVGISEKIIQISAPVWLGNSGGGAFDEDGRLIGICSWISKNGPQLTFFVHRDAINKFIVDNVTNF